MRPTAFSPFVAFHWPQNTTPWMTMNGHFTWNSFFSQVHLEYLRGFFENNCVENNKARPILSAAEMFSMNSAFWRYELFRLLFPVVDRYWNRVSIDTVFELAVVKNLRFAVVIWWWDISTSCFGGHVGISGCRPSSKLLWWNRSGWFSQVRSR